MSKTMCGKEFAYIFPSFGVYGKDNDFLAGVCECVCERKWETEWCICESVCIGVPFLLFLVSFGEEIVWKCWCNTFFLLEKELVLLCFFFLVFTLLSICFSKYN